MVNWWEKFVTLKTSFYPEDSGSKRYFSLLCWQNSESSENTNKEQAVASTQTHQLREKNRHKGQLKNNTSLQVLRGMLTIAQGRFSGWEATVGDKNFLSLFQLNAFEELTCTLNFWVNECEHNSQQVILLQTYLLTEISENITCEGTQNEMPAWKVDFSPKFILVG